jgi:N-methylhydantoinase A
MRIATDTGGTFTDLMLETDEGELRMFKAATIPSDPVKGVLDAVALAAQDAGQSPASLLRGVDTFIHGTTHAINAIVTGRTARTALVTTKGHRDVLLLREGGRLEPFNRSISYPEPFIPRALTFEVVERVNATGDVLTPLDEAGFVRTIEDLRKARVE